MYEPNLNCSFTRAVYNSIVCAQLSHSYIYVNILFNYNQKLNLGIQILNRANVTSQVILKTYALNLKFVLQIPVFVHVAFGVFLEKLG